MRDERTTLSWTARDTGAALAWDAAERHCRELGRGPGAAAWRLPSAEELATLYDASEAQPCDGGTCRVDPAITLTTPYQWSSTRRGEGRRVYLDFQHGSELAPLLRPDLTRGVLCVRGSLVAPSEDEQDSSTPVHE